ncbi:MAG: anti-sigma factor [Pseudomonadota bacterium]
MTISGKDKDVLAGELALGVLEGQERADALRKLLSDPDFAERVEHWRQDLGGLYDALPEVEPSPHVWQNIAQEISGAGAVETLPPQTDGAVAFWRRSAIVSGAVAAALMVALVLPRGEAPSPQLAQGSDTQQQQYAFARFDSNIEGLILAARFDNAAAKLRVRVEGMPDTETVPVLWVVGAGGEVRPLGIVNRSGETVLAVADGPRGLIRDGAQFSVSMEPESDTPHTQPTSDFVAQGTITTI